jgi:hypothetical protein
MFQGPRPGTKTGKDKTGERPVCPRFYSRFYSIQAVKLSVSRRLAIGGEFSGRFWQSRSYDFNLWGQQKEVEKLKYMHRNPVVRGLVATPEDWRWSSYRSYAYREAGLVRINDWDWWEDKIRRSSG